MHKKKETFIKYGINIAILTVLSCFAIFTILYGTGIVGDTGSADQEEASDNTAKSSLGTLVDTTTTAEAVQGSMENPFLIRNEKEFLKFADDVNAGNTYAGQYVELLADLNFRIMTEGIHVGTADAASNFQGVFNGNGHVISNLNIQVPDGEAGLFVNLAGTVCNLTVKDGTVQGMISGGIASSMIESGAIVNCSSQIIVQGETSGGIVGKSSGHVSNCVNYEVGGTGSSITGDSSSGVVEYCYNQTEGAFALYNNYRGDETLPEESRTMLQVLNDRLDQLHNLYTARGWDSWIMDQESPVLTQTPANLIAKATLGIRVSGNSRELKGYYSENEKAWCFAIPEGADEDSRTVALTFTEGDTDTLVTSLDVTELEYDHDEIHYKFKFLKNDTIPSVFIDTNEANGEGLSYLNLSKLNQLAGETTILNEKGATVYTGLLDRVKGRGNDSWLAAKKGYSIKLKVDSDLLGLGANKDFALLPGYRDNSLMSYRIIQDMTKEMQIPYALESKIVNLYIDNNFLGTYLLSEKMGIDNNRIPITNLYKQTKKMNGNDLTGFEQVHWKNPDTGAERIWYQIEKEPQDYTGGYLLELDTQDYDGTQSRFVSDRGIAISLKSNNYASENQVNYIADFWQDFENAVYAPDGYNEKGKYYTEYIDAESFANMWAMYELTEDTSMRGSVYFYKDADDRGDGLLHAAYLWDVEHSFVEEEYINKSWVMGRMKGDLVGAGYWTAIYQHGDFAQLVNQQWTDKIAPAVQKLLNPEEIIEPEGLSSISGYERAYTYAGALNSTRWTNCNWWDKGERVRQFLTTRMEFLNQTLPAYGLGYDYYSMEDGIYYGYHYAQNEGEEDVREPVVAQ
ncbi:MAG: hypothetical protein PHE02_09450 [Lachnospiraceae bacterium]|nr:hypothetical protein [Lachnospiraceae bacterium]